MRPLLKATVIVVSLMCAASAMALAGHRVPTRHPNVVMGNIHVKPAMALAVDPSVWLTDVQALMVANYEAGVARADQERADAEAAKAEQDAADRARSAMIATPTPVAPRGLVGWESFAACVIAHESGGNPTAANPRSSASGLFQDLDSTWGGYGGYSRAMYAPADVQYAMNYELWVHSGSAPWAGSGC